MKKFKSNCGVGSKVDIGQGWQELTSQTLGHAGRESAAVLPV